MLGWTTSEERGCSKVPSQEELDRLNAPAYVKAMKVYGKRVNEIESKFQKDTAAIQAKHEMNVKMEELRHIKEIKPLTDKREQDLMAANEQFRKATSAAVTSASVLEPTFQPPGEGPRPRASKTKGRRS